MATPSAGAWCNCPDAPLLVRGAATLLDHPGGCAFPASVCTVRAHRVSIHEGCGREMPMRYCGCPPSGYTLDIARGWWVHYSCGWPTKPWFDAAGQPAREELRGLRPITYHEFATVPRSPKPTYDRLTDEQKRINDTYVGASVWD